MIHFLKNYKPLAVVVSSDRQPIILNKVFLFLLPFILVFGISCKKYLDKKSDSSLAVPSTIEDLQALLDFSDQINNNTPILGEVSCDDYFNLDATYNLGSEKDRNAYRWMPFDYNWRNDWSGGYQPVYTSNLCLERLEMITKTSANESKWNNIKGSALFLRAYHFLHLAWVYSNAFDKTTFSTDLGIVLRLTSDFNVQSVRSTVKETYNQIINDVMESIIYLPDNPQHVMRPSKGAAYGLLAKTYLSMREYDSALKYSNLSLSIKNSLLDFNNSSDVQVNSTTPFQPFNKEVIFHSQIVPEWLTPIISGYALVDTILYSSYNTNDLRKAAFFRPLSGYQQFKRTYTGRAQMFTGIATDEMYLIRAECLARTDNKDGSLADLNFLTTKRWKTGTFIPFTASSSEEALKIILVERRKELIRRGLRWIDIKRLNKEGANITLKRIVEGQSYTLLPNDAQYALPLPKDIIEITGLQQN